MQLRKRVERLESASGGQTTRFVWCEVGRTDAEALDTYWRHCIGVNDDMPNANVQTSEHFVLISWQGGNDAIA